MRLMIEDYVNNSKTKAKTSRLKAASVALISFRMSSSGWCKGSLIEGNPASDTSKHSLSLLVANDIFHTKQF